MEVLEHGCYWLEKTNERKHAKEKTRMERSEQVKKLTMTKMRMKEMTKEQNDEKLMRT
jgi:hypothetical protein